MTEQLKSKAVIGTVFLDLTGWNSKIVCSRCYSDGRLCCTMGKRGRRIYLVRHDLGEGKRRWCLIGGDLSKIVMASAPYREYERAISQGVSSLIAGGSGSVKGSKIVHMLERAGWPALFAEDKVWSDVRRLVN